MPFWRTYYHLVWATKNRQPFIEAEVEVELYDYIVRRAVEFGLIVYAINGWLDHIHLVVAIPPKYAVATIVKQLKGASSHYLNHIVRHEEWFYWQRGYGVLTIGERQKETAVAYVLNQKEHHQQRTTNSWLEKLDEFDEGPLDGYDGVLPSSIIKESNAPYLFDKENDVFPF